MGLQLNLSTTVTLGTEESGHCREVLSNIDHVNSVNNYDYIDWLLINFGMKKGQTWIQNAWLTLNISHVLNMYDNLWHCNNRNTISLNVCVKMFGMSTCLHWDSVQYN